MSNLSAQNLPKSIRVFSYDREAVQVGIVHFGIGNFHRAHQAVYVEELLEKGQTQWGIAGVSLRSPQVRDNLAPQDYLYTLAILGTRKEHRIIGAIKEVLVAPEDPQSVIDRIKNPATQIVSATITEKGYYLSSGKVDFENPALKSEKESLAAPTTIYGFIAKGLIQRSQEHPNSKLTIMCCDNISGGGDRLEDGVRALLHVHDNDALTWSKAHVSFISSMVDRVSPATNDHLRDEVFKAAERWDAVPVSAEPFTQWIIEDNFAGDRPAFDLVGADFVESIAPFERMKLGYLNAAHTMVSTIGFLFGDENVHEALTRPDVLQFVRQALYENILPFARVPKGYDGKAYIEAVIERFQNANLPYANLQVGTDSSQKIQQRWFPTLEMGLKQGAHLPYFAFCLGAWAVFINSALEAGVLNDPKKNELGKVRTGQIKKDILSFLRISMAEDYNFFRHSQFMSQVLDHAEDIKSQGIESCLRVFLNSFGSQTGRR